MTMKKRMTLLIPAIMLIAILALGTLCAVSVHAEEPAVATEETISEDSSVPGGFDIGMKAIGAGIAVGLAAMGGAIAMGLASSKAEEGIARQPEAEGSIRTTFMLGLVFIETAIIYALIVAILVIFVL